MIYKTSDGKRVPSVTTINKIGQDSGGLIHWAWSLGVDGLDYRNVRDDSADAGHVGHALVEAALKQKEPDFSGFSAEAQASGKIAYAAYVEWREQTALQIIHSELPMVSERYAYGGCTDAVTRRLVKWSDAPRGVFGIGDWKSGALYPDHLCQIAAYANLWNEKNPDKLIEEFHLCRFNRDTGAFTHHYERDLGEAWEAFKLKRELYDLLGGLKKRV